MSRAPMSDFPLLSIHDAKPPLPSVWRHLPRWMLLFGACAAFAAASMAVGSIAPAPRAGVVYIVSADDPDARDLSRTRDVVLAAPDILADSLSKYGDLPSASVAVTLLGGERGAPFSPSSSSSFSRASADGKRCIVDIQLDARGMGSLARGVFASPAAPALTAKDPGLAGRLNEFEALHELGHCAHAAIGRPVAIPGFAPDEARLVTRALSMSPSALSKLHGELFADAYAANRYLAARSAAPLFEQAVKDLRLVAAWRAAEAQWSVERRSRGLLPPGSSFSHRARLDGSTHATAPMWASILSDPAPFAAADAAGESTLRAGAALLRASALAEDSEQASKQAFGASEAIAAYLGPDLPQIAALGSSELAAEGLGQLLKRSKTPLDRALRSEQTKMGRLIWRAYRHLPASETEAQRAIAVIASSSMLIPSVAAAAVEGGLSADERSGAWRVWARAVERERLDAPAGRLWPSAGPGSLARAIAERASS